MEEGSGRLMTGKKKRSPEGGGGGGGKCSAQT